MVTDLEAAHSVAKTWQNCQSCQQHTGIHTKCKIVQTGFTDCCVIAMLTSNADHTLTAKLMWTALLSNVLLLVCAVHPTQHPRCPFIILVRIQTKHHPSPKMGPIPAQQLARRPASILVLSQACHSIVSGCPYDWDAKRFGPCYLICNSNICLGRHTVCNSIMMTN